MHIRQIYAYILYIYTHVYLYMCIYTHVYIHNVYQVSPKFADSCKCLFKKQPNINIDYTYFYH